MTPTEMDRFMRAALMIVAGLVLIGLSLRRLHHSELRLE